MGNGQEGKVSKIDSKEFLVLFLATLSIVNGLMMIPEPRVEVDGLFSFYFRALISCVGVVSGGVIFYEFFKHRENLRKEDRQNEDL